ncbi:MAG TPA: hypothetical protein VFT37_01675 [Telluria sp.]|nr:hypothetical protein [Telluria sp.]
MGAFGRFLKLVVGTVTLHERVAALSSTVADQRSRIDHLTERVARLEATFDLLMRLRGPKRLE